MSVEELVDGFCRRVVEAGFPARRFSMIIGTLHPRHGARSYVWRPAGLEKEAFPRRRTDEESEAYLRSPVYFLRRSRQSRGCAGGSTPGEPLQFLLLEELRDAGMTEYAARIVRFRRRRHGLAQERAAVIGDARFDPLQGIFFSCATDVPGGFDDDQLKQVGDALPYLALAVKSRSTFDVARTLLETYIGADAGHHVLTGEIDRHSVQAHPRGDLVLRPPRLFERREPRAAGGAAWRSSTPTSRRWRGRCSTTRGRSSSSWATAFSRRSISRSGTAKSVCVDALEGRGPAARLLPAVQRGAPRRRQAHARFRRRAAPGRSALRQYRRRRAPRLHGRGIGGERSEPHRRDVPAAAAQAAGVGRASTTRPRPAGAG